MKYLIMLVALMFAATTWAQSPDTSDEPLKPNEIDSILKQAALGNPDAMFIAGMALLVGDGLPRNPVAGEEMIVRSMQFGGPRNRLMLCHAAINGRGTKYGKLFAAIAHATGACGDPDYRRAALSYFAAGMDAVSEVDKVLAQFCLQRLLDMPTYPISHLAIQKLTASIAAMPAEPADPRAREWVVKGRESTDPAQAIANYTEALRLDSNYALAFALRAEVYEQLGQRAIMYEDLHKACTFGLQQICGWLRANPE